MIVILDKGMEIRMKVVIKNESYHYENQVSAVADILATINKKIDEENLKLSHMLIDGLEIKENYDTYISNNIDTIQEIEVFFISLKSLLDETFTSAYNYLNNGLPQVEQLADSFYKSVDETKWNVLLDLIDGIDWLIDTCIQIDKINHLNDLLSDYGVWNEYVRQIHKLSEIIPEFEEAMKQHDHVLLGDLLLYEVLPFFEVGKEKLRFLVPADGSNYVS